MNRTKDFQEAVQRRRETEQKTDALLGDGASMYQHDSINAKSATKLNHPIGFYQQQERKQSPFVLEAMALVTSFKIHIALTIYYVYVMHRAFIEMQLY